MSETRPTYAISRNEKPRLSTVEINIRRNASHFQKPILFNPYIDPEIKDLVKVAILLRMDNHYGHEYSPLSQSKAIREWQLQMILDPSQPEEMVHQLKAALKTDMGLSEIDDLSVIINPKVEEEELPELIDDHDDWDTPTSPSDAPPPMPPLRIKQPTILQENAFEPKNKTPDDMLVRQRMMAQQLGRYIEKNL